MRLCRRDKSTSSHSFGLLSFLLSRKLFAFKSLVEDGPKVLHRVLHRVNVITFGGPPFHHPNLMPFQPSRGGLCRMTRRLVLLEFPPSLFVFKPPCRGRQKRSPKCLGTRVRRACLHRKT